MPTWISRLLRTSIIGFGVVLVTLAAIYRYAMHVFFDASTEHYGGFSAADFAPLIYSVGGLGVLLVLTGILIRFPPSAPPPEPRMKRKGKARRRG